jgi:hypothetical protein
MRGRDRARQASEKEPAEGSRATVSRAESGSRAGAATGITNAPRARERASQAALPPGGGRKGQAKARGRTPPRRA